MSKTIRFNGPPDHTLEVDGEAVAGGRTFTVADDERAEELLTDPTLDLSDVTDEGDDLVGRYTRNQLDELALEVGVEDPGSLRDKAAVAAAIQEAEAGVAGAGDDSTKED